MTPDLRFSLPILPAYKLRPGHFQPIEPFPPNKFKLGCRLAAFPCFLQADLDLLNSAAEFIAALFTHPTIRPHLLHSTPQTPQQVIDQFLFPVTAGWLKCHYFFIVSTLQRQPSAVLGFIDLKQNPADASCFETGTVIHPNYQNLGIGSWARGIMEAIAAFSGAEKLVSIVSPNNVASQALTLKRGFTDSEKRVPDHTLPPELQVPDRVVYEKRLSQPARDLSSFHAHKRTSYELRNFLASGAKKIPLRVLKSLHAKYPQFCHHRPH